MKKVFCVGDAHMPWTNLKTLTAIYSAIEKEKPDVVIQMGDLYDLFSYSKFARSHDLCTPKQEIEEGRQMAENFWKRIKVKEKIQIKGNHDSRIIMRAEEKYPEVASLLNVSHLWQFPGVKTIDDTRIELKIDGVNYIHGYRSKLGDHMKYMLESVVCGHSHTGGVVFMNLKGKTIWELNCGFIADRTSVPLSYTKQVTTRWTAGYGIVDEQGPRFCPLPD